MSWQRSCTDGATAPDADTLRVKASDSCPDHHPKLGAPADDESGRGLLLVNALVTTWGSYTRSPEASVSKTVWAEIPLEPLARRSSAPC